jgi:hypothetical protein
MSYGLQEDMMQDATTSRYSKKVDLCVNPNEEKDDNNISKLPKKALFGQPPIYKLRNAFTIRLIPSAKRALGQAILMRIYPSALWTNILPSSINTPCCAKSSATLYLVCPMFQIRRDIYPSQVDRLRDMELYFRHLGFQLRFQEDEIVVQVLFQLFQPPFVGSIGRLCIHDTEW